MLTLDEFPRADVSRHAGAERQRPLTSPRRHAARRQFGRRQSRRGVCCPEPTSSFHLKLPKQVGRPSRVPANHAALSGARGTWRVAVVRGRQGASLVSRDDRSGTMATNVEVLSGPAGPPTRWIAAPSGTPLTRRGLVWKLRAPHRPEPAARGGFCRPPAVSEDPDLSWLVVIPLVVTRALARHAAQTPAARPGEVARGFTSP